MQTNRFYKLLQMRILYIKINMLYFFMIAKTIVLVRQQIKKQLVINALLFFVTE